MELFLLRRTENGLEPENTTNMIGVFSTSFKAKAVAELWNPGIIGKWTGDYPFGWQAEANEVVSYVIDIMQVDKEW